MSDSASASSELGLQVCYLAHWALDTCVLMQETYHNHRLTTFLVMKKKNIELTEFKALNSALF